ncbi:MAG: hypothetical protein AB1465_06880 [Patescibacteria group bacterium]
MKILTKGQTKFGSSLLLPAYGREGQGQRFFFLAAHFAKRNTKFGGGESEGGAGIHFPLTPFSARPARAEKFFALPSRRRREQSKFKVRIFVKKSSDFAQKTPPIITF